MGDCTWTPGYTCDAFVSLQGGTTGKMRGEHQVYALGDGTPCRDDTERLEAGCNGGFAKGTGTAASVHRT